MTSRSIIRITIAVIAPLFLIVLGMRNPYLQKSCKKPQPRPRAVLAEIPTGQEAQAEQNSVDDAAPGPAPSVARPCTPPRRLDSSAAPSLVGVTAAADLCARGSPFSPSALSRFI